MTKQEGATKIIKHRLFTYFEEVDDPATGGKALRERIAHLGQEVFVPRGVDVVRGLHSSIDAFYTEEEAKKIKEGTYNGPDAESLYAARNQTKATPFIAPADGEHGDIGMMDAAELADYITVNKLNIQATLSLLPADADSELIQKLLDAENIATGNDPRSGVTEPLEKKLVTD